MKDNKSESRYFVFGASSFVKRNIGYHRPDYIRRRLTELKGVRLRNEEPDCKTNERSRIFGKDDCRFPETSVINTMEGITVAARCEMISIFTMDRKTPIPESCIRRTCRVAPRRSEGMMARVVALNSSSSSESERWERKGFTTSIPSESKLEFKFRHVQRQLIELKFQAQYQATLRRGRI
jgi:hypothetical protein